MDEGAILFRRYLDGDESAFTQLLALYHDSLIFFIYRYVRDLDAAEDLAEDTFLELLLHKNRVRFDKKLKPYLFTIARNKALNYIKYRARHLVQSLEDEAELPDEAASLEEKILQNEEQRALLSVLRQLSPDYRQVLYLLYVEELSYEEIGRVMKKNRKQVENLAYRGRAAARAALKKERIWNEDTDGV